MLIREKKSPWSAPAPCATTPHPMECPRPLRHYPAHGVPDEEEALPGRSSGAHVLRNTLPRGGLRGGAGGGPPVAAPSFPAKLRCIPPRIARCILSDRMHSELCEEGCKVALDTTPPQDYVALASRNELRLPQEVVENMLIRAT